MYSNLELTGTFSPRPFNLLKDRMEFVENVFKLWSHTQVSVVVLENKFCIYRRLKQLQKLQSLGGNQEVTESNLPFSSRPLQMKTRWHFQQTAFKWNVKCVWRNLKHHKLLEHKALPHFLQKAIKAHVEFIYSFWKSIKVNCWVPLGELIYFHGFGEHVLRL